MPPETPYNPTFPHLFPLPMSELFAPSSISVSELNALAKALLEDHLAGLWIAGEVSNLTRAASERGEGGFGSTGKA